jgi:hypothetical protein
VTLRTCSQWSSTMVRSVSGTLRSTHTDAPQAASYPRGIDGPWICICGYRPGIQGLLLERWYQNHTAQCWQDSHHLGWGTRASAWISLAA